MYNISKDRDSFKIHNYWSKYCKLLHYHDKSRTVTHLSFPNGVTISNCHCTRYEGESFWGMKTATQNSEVQKFPHSKWFDAEWISKRRVSNVKGVTTSSAAWERERVSEEHCVSQLEQNTQIAVASVTLRHSMGGVNSHPSSEGQANTWARSSHYRVPQLHKGWDSVAFNPRIQK